MNTRFRTFVRNIIVAVALVPCAGACDAGTGGRPIQFSLALAGAAAPGQPLAVSTNTNGWQITLERACIAVGPIYFFAGAGHLSPDETATRSSFMSRQLARLSRSLIPPARALPGSHHFDGGEVRGEWLSQAVVDLLSPTPLSFGAQNGLEGKVGSYSLMLDPPGGDLARDPCLSGHHAFAEGSARRGVEMVRFRGGLDLEATADKRRAQGLPISGHFTEGATILVTVHPAAWFADARFESLHVKEPDGAFVITGDSQVRAAWFVAVRSNAAFSASVNLTLPALP